MSSDSSQTPQQASPKSHVLILTLGLIAIISGLSVVLTFQFTFDRIQLNKQAALEEAIFTVLPEATTRRNFHLDEDKLEPLPDDAFDKANLFAGYDEDGNLTGIAMEASARGYQDVVTILYGYSLKSECVIGMTVLESTETPGIGDKVETDPDFRANFDCLHARLNEEETALKHEIVTVKSGNKENPWEIDGISGATITSNAIGTALRKSTNSMLPTLAKHRDELPSEINP